MTDPTSIYAYLEKPSLVDYPGRFAAVFFTSGCSFSCGFCHNAALIGRKQEGLPRKRIENACEKFKKEWVNGVVITGGEPTCSTDLPELIDLFRNDFGFPVKLDTNGSNPESIEPLLPLVDYVAMDIKCGLSAYPDVAGFADTEKILRSIELIRTKARDYEFRTTVIESVHTDEQMDEVCRMIEGSKRYALQAFIPRDDLPGRQYRTLSRTSSARLQELKNRMSGCAEEILLRGG
ncbi:MAG TPA: anaerobic ribonucleoside-triphosphate reductase activating protein [Pontiella sp.]